AAHGRSAARRWPHRRYERADDEAFGGDLVHHPFELAIARVDADVGIEQKEIDAVKPDAVRRRVRREIQHGIEIDRRLGARASLAAGPWAISCCEVWVTYSFFPLPK